MTGFSGEQSVFVEGDVYLSKFELGSHFTKAPSLARILFVVQGSRYQGLESPWDYLCATHPEERPLAIDPELKAELDAWDAASDNLPDE